MNRFVTIIILVFCCFSFIASSQVYVSKLIEHTVLIAPEYVQPMSAEIAIIYKDNTQSFLQQLHSLELENQSILQELEQNKPKDKKSKKRLAKAKRIDLKIKKESEIATHFLQLWADVEHHESSTSDIFKLVSNTKSCYEIFTKTDNYTPDEYKIISSRNFMYKASIPVTFNKEKQEWISNTSQQKVSSSTSCSSSCGTASSTMHSLKTTPASCKFKQYGGSTYNKATCPEGFTYDETSQSCVLYQKIENNTGTTQYQVIRTSDQQPLEINDWKKIDCQQETWVSKPNPAP